MNFDGMCEGDTTHHGKEAQDLGPKSQLLNPKCVKF